MLVLLKFQVWGSPENLRLLVKTDLVSSLYRQVEKVTRSLQHRQADKQGPYLLLLKFSRFLN